MRRGRYVRRLEEASYRSSASSARSAASLAAREFGSNFGTAGLAVIVSTVAHWLTMPHGPYTS